jgi:hypothetical protein
LIARDGGRPWIKTDAFTQCIPRSTGGEERAEQSTCASFLQSHMTARGATPEAIAIETGQIAWPGECLIVPVISRLCNRRLHDADLKGFQKTSKP